MISVLGEPGLQPRQSILSKKPKASNVTEQLTSVLGVSSITPVMVTWRVIVRNRQSGPGERPAQGRSAPPPPHVRPSHPPLPMPGPRYPPSLTSSLAASYFPFNNLEGY